jgi:16S rRNA (guanine527-N7)-methyltransferase
MTVRESRALPEWLDVSRETQQKFQDLLDLVARWNPAINLVASGTLADGWQRHILDSAQIFELGRRETGLWADLGSGAGFPGLVLAIMAAERAPGLSFVLVESDRRKATFLSQAARSLGVSARMICARAEQLAPLRADILTARAFAPLDQLCGHAARHLAAAGLAIFPKGARHDAELAQAARAWRFDQQRAPSRTDSESVILMLRNIRHV